MWEEMPIASELSPRKGRRSRHSRSLLALALIAAVLALAALVNVQKRKTTLGHDEMSSIFRTTIQLGNTHEKKRLRTESGALEHVTRTERNTLVIFKVKTLTDDQHCLLKRFTSLFDLVDSFGWDILLMYNEEMNLGSNVKDLIARHEHVSHLKMPLIPEVWHRFGLDVNDFAKAKWGATLWFARSHNYDYAWL